MGWMLAVSLILAQAVSPGSQVPRAPGAREAAGTAVIKGKVTAADTGRPLRRARVTIASQSAGVNRSTATNLRGEYEIRDLPAGRYTLSVQRSGYLPLSYGQRRVSDFARPIEVGDGQTFEKMDLAMARAGVISGRVIDETGEPVANVAVWPMRLEYFRGRRKLVPAGSEGRSDDIGQYRILNMPPGEYLVMAVLRETWVAGPEKQTFGYAPTFFPGIAQAADATRVKVAVGQEVPNTDFALVASRAAVLSGFASAADGRPLAGARVGLSFDVLGPSGGMSMGITSATVAADGSWRMKNVPPGEYLLDVSAPQEHDQPPARAYMTVLVQGADVEGLTLVADTGGTVTGQLVTDTGEALPPATGGRRVSAESLSEHRSSGILMGDDNGAVKSDGRFTIRGVLGRSVLRVSGLPRGWVVKQVDAGDRDFAESPIELRGGQTLDVRVVVTNRFPEVTGRITDERGNPAEGTVMLFPADGEKWFDTAALRTTRPDQSGVFRMESVRPGEYLAVALDVVQRWQVQDPEFLEDLRGVATAVTVREGQPQQLVLKIRQ